MQRVSGSSGELRAEGNERCGQVLSGLRGLVCSKYCDIVLLVGVTLAFCMLLAASAIG